MENSNEELDQLRQEVGRLRYEMEAQRRHADQWRQVAEDRRVALERLRQHPAVRVLLWGSRKVLPSARRAVRRGDSLIRRTRKRLSELRGVRYQITVGRREQELYKAVDGLPEPPSTSRAVSLIILTHNGIGNLRQLIPALRRMIASGGVEVIIFDNGSAPPTAEFLSRQTDIRVIRSEANLSFSAANNEAARRAWSDAEVLCFLNDDVVPLHSGWLQRMVAAVSEPGVGAVGAQLVYPRRRLFSSRNKGVSVQHRGISFTPVPEAVPEARNLGRGSEPVVEARTVNVAAATGACLAVKRDEFNAVGGFYEGYWYGAEDVDVCWRLRRRGCRILVHLGAVLFHDEGATRHVEDAKAAVKRQKANWELFADRFGPELNRSLVQDRLMGELALTDKRYHLVITVTRDDPEAGYGDWYLAHELRGELEELGWRVSFVERYRDSWETLPGDMDALLVLLDVCDLRRVRRLGASVPVSEDLGVVKIAWVRNWAERWTGHPWFHAYDLVLASGETIAQRIRSATRHEPTIMPLATNPERFRPTSDTRSGTLSTAFNEVGRRQGAVFTGNYWGHDVHLDRLVHSVPELAVYGKGWGSVPIVAQQWRGWVPYEELPEIYRRAVVVIDRAADHTRADASVNTRVFDAIAAGALVVTDQIAGVQELFEGHIPTYESPDECAAKVQTFLAEPSRAADMAEELRTEVLAHHTWSRRAEQLQELLLKRSERASFLLRTSVPNRKVAPRWGDLHLAESLARELRNLGHPTRVEVQDEWPERAGRAYDVAVPLRGRSRAPRSEGQLQVIWSISHPEELTVEECEESDLVLVAGSLFADELRHRINTPVGVLLQATDESRFRPQGPEAEHAHDVAFVGNSRLVMRPVVRDALVAGVRPAIYGSNWEKFVDPDLVVSRHVPNEQLPHVYSSVRVLLNDHWAWMRTYGYVSNRLFDALGCGSCVVSDEVPGLEELFDGGVVTYKTPEELLSAVTGLLDDEARRREQGERGRRAVLERHTFSHRAVELLHMLAPLLEQKRTAIGSNSETRDNYASNYASNDQG